jgi:apolipoprotein N-acyltransferase
LSGLRVASASPNLPVSLAAAAASGVLLWLSLPPADLGPLAFVALVPLLWAIHGARRARRAALLGLVAGITFYGPLLNWILSLSVLGWIVLVLGVGAWVALFGAYARAVWRDEAPLRTALAVGAAWAAVEWLRLAWPFEGWGWVGLGYTQHDNPLLLPAASLVGALGISFLLAAVNTLVLFAALRVGEWRKALAALGVAAVLAVGPALIPASRTEGPPVSVAVVQGNVPVQIGTRSRLILDRIVAENHAALNLHLSGDPPDLVVWPENALDQDPTRDLALGGLVSDSVRAVGAPTLVGAITQTSDGRLLNENLLYAPDGRIVDRYAKQHLLAFGEYVPFRELLDWIPDVGLVRADLSPGSAPGRFRIGDFGFASIICYENAFPGLVRNAVTPDQGFLVVSTNNSTFGVTSAPEQHVVLSELRAVETGRWVVHAALSGISAVISPSGEVTARTPLFEPAIVRARFPTASGRTVYDVVGAWLPTLYLLIALVAFVAPRRARPRPVPALPGEPRVGVVVPTYNERETIEEVVDRVLATGEQVDVLVVDDSSPDGTGDVVRKIADRDTRVRLVDRPEKGGLASAYLDGFVLAVTEGYDLIVEMDADLSHQPEELKRLLEAVRDHHLAIGSRYVRGGVIRNWSPFRRLLSRGGNLYVRLLLGVPIADSTSGYRVYRWDTLRELITHQLRSEGYGFQIELAYRAWRRGMSVGEVPITFEERRHGHSKISRAIVVEALWHVFVWAIRDRLFRWRPASRSRHPSTMSDGP